jgi:hypothetical protein
MRPRATTGIPSQLTVAGYDGTTPFTGGRRPPGTFQGRARAAVTATFVIVPFTGLAVAAWLAWGHGLNLAAQAVNLIRVPDILATLTSPPAQSAGTELELSIWESEGGRLASHADAT